MRVDAAWPPLRAAEDLTVLYLVSGGRMRLTGGFGRREREQGPVVVALEMTLSGTPA